MAKETKSTKPEQTKSSIAPIAIIGIILVATIAGIYLITQSGGNAEQASTTANSGSGAGTGGSPAEQQPLPNYGSAPPGALPPHFKGSDNSPVIIEEFADFQCPTCAVVHPRMNEVQSRFGSRIKFVFRNYPLTNIHRNAYDAAVAAEAAGFQGKFWDMQNLLMVNQAQWSNAAQPRPIFEQYAQRIGIDVERFKNDMLGFGAKGRVDEDMRRARALNLSGTPTILVNGKVVNSYETEVIAQAVEAELKKFEQRDEPADEGSEGANENGPEDAKPAAEPPAKQ